MSKCGYTPEYCGKLEQHEEHAYGVFLWCGGGNACPIGYDHSAFMLDAYGQESCTVCGWGGEGDEYWHD